MSSSLRHSALRVAAVVSCAATAASAANITFFQFAGEVEPPALKEFIYDPGTGLSEGPGAIGNPGTNFVAPGFWGCITGGLPGIASNPPGFGSGPLYNILSDLSLDLTGFNEVGNAVVGASSITQQLGPGSFSLTYKPLAGPDLILLQGTVASATLTETPSGVDPTSAGSAAVLSGLVTYTNGLLLSGFATAGLSNFGGFSFAMSGMVGSYGTTSVSGENRLARFTADGAGTFDAAVAVPVPSAAWAGLGLLGLLGAVKLKGRASDE